MRNSNHTKLFLNGSQNKPKTDKTNENRSSSSVTNNTNLAYDIDKLAKAVAMHETADCTLGSAKYSNCFGIMTWPNGKRQFKRYATKEESYEDFKRIWLKSYKTFPTLALAKKYSGNDRAEIWLRNVKKFYYQQQ